jgi:hypothetical protein
MGTAPYNEFCLLCPAEKDTKPDTMDWKHKKDTVYTPQAEFGDLTGLNSLAPANGSRTDGCASLACSRRGSLSSRPVIDARSMIERVS